MFSVEIYLVVFKAFLIKLPSANHPLIQAYRRVICDTTPNCVVWDNKKQGNNNTSSKGPLPYPVQMFNMNPYTREFPDR